MYNLVMLKFWLIFVITIFFELFLGQTDLIFAQSGLACDVNISPVSVQPNSSSTLNFNVTNTGVPDIIWVWIGQPSDEVLTVTGGNNSGWSILEQSTGMVLYNGGTIVNGSSFTFALNVTSGGTIGAISTWKVMVSHMAGGNETVDCTGSSQVVVEESGSANPVISNISLTAGNNSATVSWNTDIVASSRTDYGPSNSYGSNNTSNNLITSHSLAMSGLSASTTYHYKLTNVGQDGGTATTSDLTFTTSAASVTTTTTTTVTTIITPTPTPKPLVDTVAPVVNITTIFEKPYKIAPTIEGKSVDGGAINVGVVSIDYSLDNGKNWLPVDYIETVGKKAVNFEFTPVGLDDGNYLVQVRSKDATGNMGISKKYTMVIDRLPPQVGGSLFTIGPMILKPDFGGNIYSIAGMEMKVILGAIGGPINMDLSYNQSKFVLTKNEESGLWSGILNINNSGNFELLTKSIDGAKNVTERKLGNVIMLTPGKILDEHNKPIIGAKVSVYIYEKTLNNFVLWDALPYLENNPQLTTQEGEYKLILPPGKYFIEVESKSKRKLRSFIFEIENSTPLNQKFVLNNATYFGNWWAKNIPIELVLINENDSNTNLIDKMIPSFDLNDEFSSTTILGKPTLITFFSSWEPQTSDQLLILDRLKSDNSGINVIAVAAQESISKINIFKKIGGYSIPIVADADGVLVVPFNLGSLPTHVIVDRKGIIKSIRVGFMNETALLKLILN